MTVYNPVRLRVEALVSTNEPRMLTYDAQTANVDGNTDVALMSEASQTVFWETTATIPSKFRRGDLVMVQCTNGAVYVICQSVNSVTGLATFTVIPSTATT